MPSMSLSLASGKGIGRSHCPEQARERAQEISVFITPNGSYSYKVVPFRLYNAPATFQRLMTKALRDLEG